MPRTRRTQVPISETALEALQAYADATDSSIPQVAAALLDQVSPQLVELAHAFKTAKQAPSKALSEAVEMLQKEAAKANQLALDMEKKTGS